MEARYRVGLLLGLLALGGCAHGRPGCSSATVVAIGADIDAPAQRTPTPYLQGGDPTDPPLPKGAKPLPNGLTPGPASFLRGGAIPSDTELSDGHVYRFESSNVIDEALSGGYDFVKPNQPSGLRAGEAVQICGVQSKLSGRIYYRINDKPVYREL